MAQLVPEDDGDWIGDLPALNISNFRFERVIFVQKDIQQERLFNEEPITLLKRQSKALEEKAETLKTLRTNSSGQGNDILSPIHYAIDEKVGGFLGIGKTESTTEIVL